MLAINPMSSRMRIVSISVCIICALLIGASLLVGIISTNYQRTDKHHKQVDNLGRSELKKYPTLDTLVSLVELFCDPEKYHGKQIAVEGFFIYEFEGTALYLNSESADYRIGANAIWVDLSSLDVQKVPRRDEWKKFHRQYIRIEGHYNKENMGHFGHFHGAIERITRVYKLSTYD